MWKQIMVRRRLRNLFAIEKLASTFQFGAGNKVTKEISGKIKANGVGLSNCFDGNFGDLLGPYLFEKISLEKPNTLAINYQHIRESIDYEHYLIAGSILQHVTPYAKLWGIGIMNQSDVDRIRKTLTPENVFALRGPETMKALIEAGLIRKGARVAFGDPGLLLPLVYSPKKRSSVKLGVIPHHTEFDEVKNRYKGSEEISVIQLGKLGHYENVERVLDTLGSCERVASSSLHGIICAHAYGIPAAWCNFTSITKEGRSGTTFLKFLDYYGSVKLAVDRGFDATSSAAPIPEGAFTLPPTATIKKLQRHLLKSCPFNVHSLNARKLLKIYS